MNKKILCFTFILLSFCANSQIWVQNNAVWHYDFDNSYEDGIYVNGFLKVEYNKDTVLDAKTSKMFLTTKYRFTSDVYGTVSYLGNLIIDTNYTWNNSDTVFYWRNNQFEILYDFTRTIGDSWVIGNGGNGTNGCSDISTVEVTNEGILNLSGINYKSFDLYSADSCSYKMRGQYNSRFGQYSVSQGMYNLIFPNQSWFCDPSIPDESVLLTFKCFHDDGLIFNPSGVDCEYILNHIGIEEIENNIFKIYPNPSEGAIVIESLVNDLEIMIYNMLGVLFEKHELNSFNNTIKINLAKGIYLIEVKSKQKKQTKCLTVK